MDLTVDARRAIPGLLGLILGRRDAVNKFNLSLAAFWRVFWLVMGVILTLEVAYLALEEREGVRLAYDATLVALSIVGGSAAAVQVLLVMGAMEDWEHRILRFLIPLLWIGAALWTAVTVWEIANLGLGFSDSVDTFVRTMMSLVAVYTAWQAARFGLRLTIGGACAVLIVYACAEFAGFTLVNMSIILLSHY